SQNEIASGRDRTAWTPNHYTHWLGYGLLEQGRYREALRHLELMRRNTDWATGRGLALLAQMRADYVVNTERWDSPCLQWRLDLASARSRAVAAEDRKSTRLNSSHVAISYAVFCLKKKNGHAARAVRREL